MKVQNNIGPNINQIESAKTDRVDIKGKAQNKDKAVGPSEADLASASRVNLSPRAQEMKRVKELAMAAPEVDEAKVAKFQKLIDEGKYKVDAKSLADKMVDEHLMMGE